MPAHPPLTDPDVTDGCSSGTRVPRIWALFFTEFSAARNDASGTNRTSSDVRYPVAIRGRPDMARIAQFGRAWWSSDVARWL